MIVLNKKTEKKLAYSVGKNKLSQKCSTQLARHLLFLLALYYNREKSRAKKIRYEHHKIELTKPKNVNDVLVLGKCLIKLSTIPEILSRGRVIKSCVKCKVSFYGDDW